MNKPYKSTLAPLLEQYLDYRRSIGFTSFKSKVFIAFIR